MVDALRMYGFISQDVPTASTRGEVTGTLLSAMKRADYPAQAVARLPDSGRDLLRLVTEHGGTSGSLVNLEYRYRGTGSDVSLFWVALRSLMRLGLAYVLHGQERPYVVLAEGVASVT